MKHLVYIVLIAMIGISCSETPACMPPESITYTEHVKPIVEKNCFECHAPDKYKAMAGRNKIYEYKHLVSMAERGNLMGAVNHEKGYTPMPFNKGIKIDTCERVILQKWIDQGMLE